MTLHLIRHAEVEARYQGVFGGVIDMNLSPLGHALITRLDFGVTDEMESRCRIHQIKSALSNRRFLCVEQLQHARFAEFDQVRQFRFAERGFLARAL